MMVPLWSVGHEDQGNELCKNIIANDIRITYYLDMEEVQKFFPCIRGVNN
jgi:hypothetical protein